MRENQYLGASVHVVMAKNSFYIVNFFCWVKKKRSRNFFVLEKEVFIFKNSDSQRNCLIEIFVDQNDLKFLRFSN